LAHNDYPGIVREERELYLLQRFNSMPGCPLEIQSTPPHGHLALISSHYTILVVTIPRVTETFKSVINEVTHATKFKLLNLLHNENVNLIHEDRNTSIEEPETRCNIHLVSYDILTSSAKPSSNGQLSYCSRSGRMLDECHRYNTHNNLGW
jgi:hypothetical protein